MNKKLPQWKDRVVAENIQELSDQELASRVQQHHAACVAIMKKIKRFTDENK